MIPTIPLQGANDGLKTYTLTIGKKPEAVKKRTYSAKLYLAGTESHWIHNFPKALVRHFRMVCTRVPQMPIDKL